MLTHLHSDIFPSPPFGGLGLRHSLSLAWLLRGERCSAGGCGGCDRLSEPALGATIRNFRMVALAPALPVPCVDQRRCGSAEHAGTCRLRSQRGAVLLARIHASYFDRLPPRRWQNTAAAEATLRRIYFNQNVRLQRASAAAFLLCYAACGLFFILNNRKN